MAGGSSPSRPAKHQHQKENMMKDCKYCQALSECIEMLNRFQGKFNQVLDEEIKRQKAVSLESNPLSLKVSK